MDMPRLDLITRVGPVGLLEKPAEGSESPRRFSLRLRLVAGFFVLLFLLVTVASTVTSLGRYCLTTDAADTRALHHAP
ncbi:MAG TPA: hypothetical protein VH988_34045 [Thermoanaerobaculia bacterium]|jgi:uncharacterized iron-regulated membrane protein|nr:hypothetical protein [Thermoanaerobaculia bacterium]